MTLEAALVSTLNGRRLHRDRTRQKQTTGVGLIEIYDLRGGIGPELANISTRGFVNTGSDVMIAGFIVASAGGGSGKVIRPRARAIVSRFRGRESAG